jgi:hypothetical protein
MVWPIFISVSVTPGAFSATAKAAPPARTNPTVRPVANVHCIGIAFPFFSCAIDKVGSAAFFS